MKIEKMIGQLKKIAEKYPGTDVRLHHPCGNIALFVLCSKCTNISHESTVNVFIEDESDIDVRSELYAQIENGKENALSDEEILIQLFDIGFNFDHIKEFLDKEDYEYWLNVGKENGLV